MMVLKEIQTLLMSHIEIYTAWLLTPVSLRTSVLPFTLRPGEATPTGSGDQSQGSAGSSASRAAGTAVAGVAWEVEGGRNFQGSWLASLVSLRMWDGGPWGRPQSWGAAHTSTWVPTGRACGLLGRVSYSPG